MADARLAWGPAAIWAAVLFFLSAQPTLPGPSWFPLGAAGAHVVFFAILGGSLAWGRAYGRHSPPAFVLVMAGVLYGALDEWHQSFVPGRTPSLADWAFDIVGVVLGYLVLQKVLSRYGSSWGSKTAT